MRGVGPIVGRGGSRALPSRLHHLSAPSNHGLLPHLFLSFSFTRQVLARTPDSPCVSLDFGGRWYSTQFHPEASHVFFQTLVDAELVTLSAPPFRELTTGTRLIANFVNMARKHRDGAAGAS